ncbi:transposase IS116/IS110/IS902 family-like protein [Thioalkalivibrio nitratireducens DSM 14787]|uniref:Transposase IS116/IS110/IS902 family-like protein n=1 Tax=Thioalkalivibrio nitratireducens (strain DSM 14787 / UNIQEM 213 / ALEN2) TaxID=1255043 RepID=L0DUS4_THIND|nr:transposase IS116/IS110/IS902 family-like protein [Thioalkalivibrio nitratireducens DSM 14787]
MNRGNVHADLLGQTHYPSRCAVAKGAVLQRPVGTRRLFLACAVHDPSRPCQAIRGTSEGQRVELACAVRRHQELSRPQPDATARPLSFIIGGAARPAA